MSCAIAHPTYSCRTVRLQQLQRQVQVQRRQGSSRDVMKRAFQLVWVYVLLCERDRTVAM